MSTKEKEVKNETLEILKLLVEKIEKLEKTVYNEENLLMKAGFVTTDSPTPRMELSDGIIPDANKIGKMSWEEINSLVERMGGES
jgi:hypothetical protein